MLCEIVMPTSPPKNFILDETLDCVQSLALDMCTVILTLWKDHHCMHDHAYLFSLDC